MSLGSFYCPKYPNHTGFQHCTSPEAKHFMSFGSIDTLGHEVNVFTTNKLLIRYQLNVLANTPRGISLQAEVTALKAKHAAIRAVNAALLERVFS